MTKSLVVKIDKASISTMSVAELKRELAATLQVTAEHLQRLAAIWTELQVRGEDMSGLRSGLWHYMPLIASGSVRPEIVVQYAGREALLKRLAVIPVEQQDEILVKDTVPLVRASASGVVVREIKLAALSLRDLGQVIGPNGIIPVEKQTEALTARLQADDPPAAETSVRFTPQRVRIEGEPDRSLNRSDIALAVSATAKRIGDHRGRGTQDGSTIGLRVTKEIEQDIRSWANERGLTMTTAILAALQVAGIVDPRHLSASAPSNAVRDELMRQAEAAGTSRADIARGFGVSRQRVNEILSSHG